MIGLLDLVPVVQLVGAGVAIVGPANVGLVADNCIRHIDRGR